MVGLLSWMKSISGTRRSAGSELELFRPGLWGGGIRWSVDGFLLDMGIVEPVPDPLPRSVFPNMP